MVTDFYHHPKVQQARRLLIEAEQEIRAEREKEINAQLRECGCRRDEHGPPHSINYIGGVCHKCPHCFHFLQAREIQKPGFQIGEFHGRYRTRR